MSTILAADGITVRYGRETPDILQQFSLTVRPGELIGVLGPNGSGKSTLVRALSRTLRPTSGAVILAERDLYQAQSARGAAQLIGTVPQNSTVAFDFTVRDVVEMGRAPHQGKSLLASVSSHDAEVVDWALRAAGVEEFAGRPMASLSGGEQQRVLLARALAQEPSVILLDEPTASLDIRHQSEVLGLVHRLAREGRAILAVLHDLNLGATYCDQLVLMKAGQIVAQGSPADVLTAANIADVYGARVWIRCHPTSGRPLVLALPEPLADSHPSPNSGTSLAEVHVICGGGTGAGLIVTLMRLGFKVTAGGLNTGDTDQEAAEMLGIGYARETPFTALSEATLARARELAQRSDVIVLTDVPIGHANIASLQIAAEQGQAGKPVICLHPVSEEFGARDFTGGAATLIWEELIAAGAQTVPDPEGVVSALSAAATEPGFGKAARDRSA